MKKILKILFEKNRKSWEVWAYFWTYSDSKNCFSFTASEICARFKISKSTLSRIIHEQDIWNDEATYTEITNASKVYTVKFVSGGVKKKTTDPIVDQLHGWLEKYYEEKDYDYPNFHLHKKTTKTIIGKIKKLMKKKDWEVTDESITTTFQTFFERIPDWWQQNSFTLLSINKHFDKIWDQIKNNNNGKRTDKFATANLQDGDIDYTEFTKPQ